MNVVHVVPPGGGLERVVLGLVREQQRTGLDAHLSGSERPDPAADVVHTHHAGALLRCGLARRGGRPVLVHTRHALRRPRLADRFAARFADRYCCASDAIAADAVARRVAPPRRVRLVPDGLDTARLTCPADLYGLRFELGLPFAAPVVGAVGRLSGRRRPDLLLHAFAWAARRVPDAHLVVVGDGPRRAELLGL